MFILLDKYILNSIDLYIITNIGYCFEIYNFIIASTLCSVTYYCIISIIILNYIVLTVSSIK